MIAAITFTTITFAAVTASLLTGYLWFLRRSLRSESLSGGVDDTDQSVRR